MKKIALLGATGQTGFEFLQVALEAGYHIKALVRSPQKLTIENKKLEIVKGDVLNEDDIDKVVKDTDIVVSLFGHVKDSPEWLQTNGSKNIIQSMKIHNVDRIISLSGGGLPFPSKDEPKFIDKLIRKIMQIAVPKILNDAIAHAEVLEKSDTKWTIVRGPRLTNDKRKGFYKVGWVGVNSSTKITRADLADFIVNQLDDETYLNQMPFVSH